jgi:hypothetical protein
LMREAGVQDAFPRKKWRTSSTRQNPAATRRGTWSTATSPRRRPTGSGWPMRPGSPPHRACSGWPRCARRSPTRIVGWQCSHRCDTDLILGALEYAV